jgi:cell division protein FtsI (penicillin-binding protein 3)
MISPKRLASARSGVSAKTLSYASSPLLASKTPPWRSRLIVATVGLGFALLIGRAVYIQIIGTDFYIEQGEKRYAQTLDVPASRGRILDRNGLILATSVAAPSVWAIPRDFDATPAQRNKLARVLKMSARELNDRLDSGSANFTWIKRQIDEPDWEQVKALKLKGIYETPEYKRKYPEGEAAAHVVGFTSIEERGQEGIELAFQHDLMGRGGSRGVVKDRLGRVVEDLGDSIEPNDGRDVVLAIDSKVQFYAYQRIRDAVAEHKAKAGSVVVLDVQTGEVLALANYPSFNPAQRSSLSGAQVRNRALTDVAEPGSTVKPFIAALAMETGRVKPDTPIATAAFSVGGYPISDTHPREVMTVTEVIQKSSNIGAARLAMQLQPREMWELFTSVGLGQKPQIGFPGAVSGRLRPYKNWRPVDQSRMAFGYGLSTSLLQLAHAYTVFARDGELIPITMMRRQQPVSGQRVLSAAVARDVRKMLQLAAGPNGTAPGAQAIGYSVGGKTGTARKQEGKDYASDDRFRAWFVGLAPVAHPRVIVAVMVDEPRSGGFYGGDVAAPVFSQVVQQTLRMLGVPPDIELKPQIVADAVPAKKERF